MRFHVTHNMTQTVYKYGLAMDWSANKSFPTFSPLSTGSNYSLVAEDKLGLSYTEPGRTNGTYLSFFDTNPGNDTATWSVNGKVLGRQHLTTQYYINGTGLPVSTKRYNETQLANKPMPCFVDVWFSEFRYNISTGVSFDPEVILYNSNHAVPGEIQTTIVIGMVVVVIAVVAISAYATRKRRKKGDDSSAAPSDNEQ